MVTLRGTAEGWLSLFSAPGDDVTGKLELLLSFLGGDDAAAVCNGDDAFPFSLRGEDNVLLLPLLGMVSLFTSLLGEDATRRKFSHGDRTVFCSLACGDVPLLNSLGCNGVTTNER